MDVLNLKQINDQWYVDFGDYLLIVTNKQSLHKLHLARELIPFSSKFGEHLQNDLTIDRQMLISQSIGRNNLKSISIHFRFHISLE